MDIKAAQRITDNTETMVDFVNLPDRLRRISKIMERQTKAQKEVLEIAKFLEDDVQQLFSPLYVSAIAILDQISSDKYMSYEEIAIKIDLHKQTVQQIINALRKGDLLLQESPARGYRAATGRPRIGKRIIDQIK